MTKQILFIQGGGEGTHDEWDDKLVASLARELDDGYELRYPRMPKEAEPSYPAWKVAIERELAALDDGAIAVGHSVGGAILVNALAERAPKRKLAAVLLIAPPFIGPGGWPSDGMPSQQDLGERLPKAIPVHLYQGSEDETVPSEHVGLYKKAIPSVRVHKLDGRDHQLNEDLAEVAAEIRRLT